ncbi:MAG TPA: hypothetical protein VJ867_06225, partial [Gemmatimonadaceae bacterium]|nr:hypothetical protein [Gemmatimonadaceae bacterium]
APSTLVIHFRVKPFNADADVTVTGNGISPITIPVTVLFNTEPQLVTNPRGLTFTAFAGGSPVAAAVLAFNQNRDVVDSLANYVIDNGFVLPPWLDATATGLPSANFGGRDTAAAVQVTVDPGTLLADSVYTETVHLAADCYPSTGNHCSSDPKTFALPVTVVVERGLVVGVDNATIFVPAGTSTSFIDIPITNGGSTPIGGLTADVGGAQWLTASFQGGTAAPTTLRLTANPTSFIAGATVNTTVTVAASSPGGVPSRTINVTMRVY